MGGLCKEAAPGKRTIKIETDLNYMGKASVSRVVVNDYRSRLSLCED